MGSTTTNTPISALGVPGFALVTGGGSGIGRATCLLLAREACSGVAVADVNVDSIKKVKEELAKAATNPDFQCITIQVDVRDEMSVKAMVADTVKAFGRLDYAVNCAGIGLKKPFAETEMQEWDRMIAINLTGVFTCVKEEVLQMMQQEPRKSTAVYERLQRGSVVNIASLAGVAGLQHSGAYTAAKHGVVGITKTMALDYPEVKCNAIVPGYILTALTSAEGYMRTNAVNKVDNWTPMKRFGLPEEVAEANVWLLGDRSNFVHGSCLTMDGGYLAH